MEPYIVILLINLLLAYFAERSFANNKKITYLMTSLIVIANTIFAGCRDFGIGIDTTVYIDKYFDNAEDLLGFANISDTDNDFGFWCLAYIANLISDDSQSLLLVIAFFINSLIFISICQYRNRFNFNICIATLLFDMVFFCHTLNLMRQFCAIAILVFAFSQFIKKRYLVYIVLQVIALSFHKTSFVFLAVPLSWYISFVESNKLKIIYSLSVICLLFISITSFFYVLSVIGDSGIINEIYADRYSSSGDYVRTTKFSGTGIIKYSIIIFNVFYIIYAKIKNVIDKNLFFFILILFIFTTLLKELGTIVSFVDRLGMYFSVIYYILTSVIMSSKKIPKPLTIIIIMIIFWDWYQLYVIGGGGDVYPYKSRILNI